MILTYPTPFIPFSIEERICRKICNCIVKVFHLETRELPDRAQALNFKFKKKLTFKLENFTLPKNFMIYYTIKRGTMEKP